MKIKKVIKMAKSLGIEVSPKIEKDEIIKAIQIKEGNFDCFGTAKDYCDQEKCLFKEDCLTLSK